MIYSAVDQNEPIKQGDIFRGIPRVDFSLSAIAVVDDEEGQRRTTWRDLLDENGEHAAVAAVVPMKSVDAIVITQDCDAMRGEYLCLCQIDEFLAARKVKTAPKNAKAWKNDIVRHSKTNQRWFYLPADPSFGFPQRMAADFRVILRVPRLDLDAMRDLRVGRLNDVGTEHFRESLGQFFRRYPYNEWYPLTKQEFEAYVESCPEQVQPYPWQG